MIIMEFDVVNKETVTLSVEREEDGCGLVCVNGISVIRFLKAGKIARIRQPSKVDILNGLGFKLNEECQIEEV